MYTPSDAYQLLVRVKDFSKWFILLLYLYLSGYGL
jgi:hypothetical protein